MPETPAPMDAYGHVIYEPMSVTTRLFHWSAIVLTCGLWYPIYRMVKRKHGEIRKPASP